MKPTLLLASLSLAAVTSISQASTELEMLRAQRAQIDRQIQSLQKEEATVDHRAPSQPTSGYTVKKGDSIERIAHKTGVSADSLAQANGLKTTSVIHPGQRLKVPDGKGNAAAPPATAKTEQAEPATSPKRYTVRQGETFYSIAKKNRISTAALMAANPGIKANALHPGLVLNLGKSKTATVSTRAESGTTPVIATKTPLEKPVKPEPTAASKTPAKPEPATAAKTPAQQAGQSLAAASTPAPARPEPASPAPVAQEPAAPAKKEVVRPVTIEGEMTYGQFAQKHGTSPERLNQLNGLDLSDATLLAKGSELYIPAQP